MSQLKPLHFPKQPELVGYQNAQVYKDKIENEIIPEGTPPCFPGAWYRKAVSSHDHWLGIEATVTLPEFLPDDNRKASNSKRYMDNPSVYFGGNAGEESDAGLTWTLVGKTAECLEPSNESLAFRPFWRYIHGDENTWKNSDFRHPEHYYLPGDTLRVSVFSPKVDYLQMQIEVVKPTTIEKFVERRKSWRIENDAPVGYVSELFPSIGQGYKVGEFKRVNAIDQSQNEGKPAKNTNSIVQNLVWHEVYLYRKINDEVYKIPFTKERFSSMLCPNPLGFSVSYEGVDKDLGGEKVTIHPGVTRQAK